jgi:hypothetical protein
MACYIREFIYSKDLRKTIAFAFVILTGISK